MVYFTHTRLMVESESSIQNHAAIGPDPTRRICSQLRSNEPRYATWLSRHDRRMWHVARGRQRPLQVVELRLVATEQIHRAALVRHLRDDKIAGQARNLLLKEFYGTLDSGCAILAEHRAFTQAVSSQLCAVDLLDMSADRFGVSLLGEYERDYGTFFAMHCDRARAISDGRQYLLASLMPEVRGRASGLRKRLLSGERLPPEPVRVRRLAGAQK